MLDTIGTLRESRGSERETSGQRNYFLLRRYGREVGEEYHQALLRFDQEEKQLMGIEEKQEQSLLGLKKEKTAFLKSKEDAMVKHEEIEWENAKMKEKLASQQDQINIYKDKKEEFEEEQNLQRRQNLMKLKEIEERQAQRQDNLSLLASKLRELKQSQQKIALLRQANTNKRIQGKRLNAKIDEIEQQNMKMLDKIAILEDTIDSNTSCIQSELKNQGDLSRKYGDLKKKKKEFGIVVKQLTEGLQQEKRINIELTNAQNSLIIQYNNIHLQVKQTKQNISELQSVNFQQRSQICSNKECLAKLQRHLQALKAQNQKIQQYMENILEQDYHIKSIIDRKFKGPTPSRPFFKDIQNHKGNQSLSSTMN